MVEQTDSTDDPRCRLVIISGRSGSGKSTALHVLEDAGFYCIDNLPAGLLPQLVQQACNAGTGNLDLMAVGIDARNIPAHIDRFQDILDELSQLVSAQVVFLDADDGCLIQRFSETRRRHPLSSSERSLPEALDAERSLLQAIADCAARTIDTSQLTLHELRDLINRSIVSEHEGMAVMFESFAFRNGLPINADLVFDARCLPNPHWVPRLRPGTGLDPAVKEFLGDAAEVIEMRNDLVAYLERWLPRFARSNRSYVTVAVGCTGGRHRSVYLAEQMFQHFQQRFTNVQVRHRELPEAGPPVTGQEDSA